MFSDNNTGQRRLSPDSSLPIGGVFATGSAIIILRMLLEDLMESPHLFPNNFSFYENLVDLGHVFLCWWILLLSLVLLSAFMLKRPFMNILSLSIIGLPVILTVPFLDLLLPGIGFEGIQYQYTFATLPHILTELFNPLISLVGIPSGVRIEIALVLIGIPLSAHFCLKSSWVRSIGTSLLSFLIILIFAYLPAFFQWAGVPEFQSHANPGAFEHMRMLFIPLMLVACGIVLRLIHEQPGGWHLLRKAIYPSRMTTYGAAFLTGYFLIRQGTSPLPPMQLSLTMEILRVATALSGIWLLFLSTKFRNDIIDLPADRISTPDRPLVTGELSVDTAGQLAVIFFALSFPLLIQGSPNELLFWLGFCGISYLYVSRHLNIRKVYPLGQGAIAALIVFLVLAGAELATAGGALKAAVFHPVFIPGLFLMAFLVANLKDFRDVEGDRAAGYRSLPMLFADPLRAVPWLICGTAFIVSILAFSVGTPMLPVAVVLIFYLIFGFWTLKHISGFHEMDKITLLTIWTILACVALFVLKHFPSLL